MNTNLHSINILIVTRLYLSFHSTILLNDKNLTDEYT